MNLRRQVRLAVSLIALAAMSSVALPQEQDHTSHHGTTGQPAQQQPAQQQPAAGCPMMGQGMMGQGMMGQGMMGRMSEGRQGMMGMGRDMVRGRTMPGATPSGMASMFGSRVTPVMNLSLEDVRGYLTVQLDRLKNKRLKIGEIKTDDGTITADIVTIDNSLVQRLEVDRHTGVIDYQD